MPGIDVRTGAGILLDVGDGSIFPSAAHLAACAGLAPATPSSGPPIRRERPSRRRNKPLKRAFFVSAFAAPADLCSATAPSTTPNPPLRVDETHRGTRGHP
jgi:transposase